MAGKGLYAFTAIRAPRGLKEEIFHVWRHDGEDASLADGRELLVGIEGLRRLVPGRRANE